MRWDYYRIPWVNGGLTPVLAGGGNALFGYSGRSFADWMKPGQRGDLTELVLGGPGSPNPDLRPWPRNVNNFGPAIGFAWQTGGATQFAGDGKRLFKLQVRLEF